MGVPVSEKTSARRRSVVCNALFDFIPYAVLVVDQNEKIVDMNPAAASLLSLAGCDETDSTWSALLPDLEMRFGQLASLTEGTFGPEIEASLRRPDGLQIPVQVTATEAADEDGRYIVAFIRDLRPNRTAERRISERERLAAIGETVTALAHESRNALQRMQSCLTLVRLRGNSEIQELTDDMQSAQNQLQDLYEEFRRYAAPMQLAREPVDVDRSIRTVWRRLRMKWIPKGLELAVSEGQSVDKTVRADTARLGQVLRNLLENAIDASPEGGRVDIAFSDAEIEGERALRFVLADEGPGIKEEDRERIFDLLFTTKQGGTGMGLAIVKRIVLAHDGEIGVEPGGSGASIRVTLPRD